MSVVSNKELLQSSRDAVKSKKVYKRISLLVDEGSFQELDAYAKSADHAAEAVTGFGYVDGMPVYVFAQDSEVDGGAMSKVQAYKIRKLYDLALKTGTPIVGIYDSVGGRLTEGAELLAAYGEILQKSNNLSGVVPQISVVLGPCVGTSALIAAGADFVIMSKDAVLTLETGDADGSAQVNSQKGMAHLVEKTEEDAIQKARLLVGRLPSNNLALAPDSDVLKAGANAELEEGMGVVDVIQAVVDEGSFIEVSPEYGTSAIAGLALINGISVGVIGYRDVVGSYCCNKAARLVRFCDAFSLPLITIVDADKFASLREAAKLSGAYSEATTIKITVITGQAVGAFYIATAGRGANADVTLAWTSAVVSPISPAAAALFQSGGELAGSENPIEDRKQLIEDYKTTKASPFAAAADGYIEDIILPGETRERLITQLELLAGKRVSTLPKKHSNLPV
ncbi:carboxyl transferase domain-containing protein [Clostridium minihomine]|uniref:carboxyl transferase domain-containing protein n=1 Tax=Clostridium minihomine TaxID=2045012 RepID=UPI0013ED0B3E|nr:carboxyl transferase domain-containing protein [Clostridium minihomine]